MERKKHRIDLKKLDLFIQKSLDLYFYVDPWKKLYERTGRIHRNVISDKSTIPDLIIYNKQFNKSECFYEMNSSTYVEYPRIRFILRPKFRKEYNPTATYGKEDEVYYIKGKNLNEHKDSSSNDEYIGEQKENLDIEEMFLKQNNSGLDNNIIKDSSTLKEDRKNIPNESKKEEDDDDEEPEWANDNVEDFYNTKIEFKSIPKSIEDKMEEEFGLEKNEIKDMNLNKIEDKNNIDIDNFFRSNSDNSINEITNQNNGDGDNKSNKSNNSNNGNDMIFKDIKDFMKNQINESENEKENPDSNNENNDNGNSSLKESEKSDGLIENFSIFEKFNNIFIDENNSNKSSNNNEQQNENKINNNFNNRNGQFFNANTNNKINNIENNSINRIDYDEIKKNNLILRQQKEKQQYLKMLQMQNINSQLNNPNIIKQSPYMYFNNPQFSNNILPSYNNPNMIQNNPNYGNINTINFHDKGTGLNPSINFYPFNNIIPGINMPNLNINNMNRGNPNFLNHNINNVNYMNNINNNTEIYVNNLNRMIFNAKNYNYSYPNKLNGNLELYQNRFDTNNYSNMNINNINNINFFNRNKNIFGQQWNKAENNNLSINANINNSKVTSNLVNEQLKSKIETKNGKEKEKEKEKEIVNPADYLEDPTLILKKNLEKKNWLVINKEGNIVHNFNSDELFKFLEDKIKKDASLEEFTINDFDTDVVFPAKFIYGNLKSFYSH
jgi:SWI/SNF-related matrix-associated actin-dependent regulator of chromatin subfamily A protein 2/4